tara:strand:+ start:746 stop:1606 length:861 start_codon:yes stop_codon:yes gene_type:complete
MLTENSNKKFYCKSCDYYAKRKGDLKKHFNSKKHNASKMLVKNSKFNCDCGKEYVHESSFYRHKTKCKISLLKNEKEKEEKDEKDNSDQTIKLLNKIMDDNKKLQEKLLNMETLIPTISNTTNNTYTNNNVINVQMFLTENCSDAMTIQNFAKHLSVTLDDLCKSKKDCITQVVLKSLMPLSVNERPFHCTNLTKSKWFIKDENTGWEEDNGEKLIKNAEMGIQKKWLNEFENQYPNWMSNDRLKEKYVEIAGSTSCKLPEKIKIKLLKILGTEAMLNKNNIIVNN